MDVTWHKPYCPAAPWLVPNVHTFHDSLAAVAVVLEGKHMLLTVEDGCEADRFAEAELTSFELLVETALFSSYVARCQLLAWLDRSILFLRDLPSR